MRRVISRRIADWTGQPFEQVFAALDAFTTDPAHQDALSQIFKGVIRGLRPDSHIPAAVRERQANLDRVMRHLARAGVHDMAVNSIRQAEQALRNNDPDELNAVSLELKQTLILAGRSTYYWIQEVLRARILLGLVQSRLGHQEMALFHLRGVPLNARRIRERLQYEYRNSPKERSRRLAKLDEQVQIAENYRSLLERRESSTRISSASQARLAKGGDVDMGMGPGVHRSQQPGEERKMGQWSGRHFTIDGIAVGHEPGFLGRHAPDGRRGRQHPVPLQNAAPLPLAAGLAERTRLLQSLAERRAFVPVLGLGALSHYNREHGTHYTCEQVTQDAELMAEVMAWSTTHVQTDAANTPMDLSLEKEAVYLANGHRPESLEWIYDLGVPELKTRFDFFKDLPD